MEKPDEEVSHLDLWQFFDQLKYDNETRLCVSSMYYSYVTVVFIIMCCYVIILFLPGTFLNKSGELLSDLDLLLKSRGAWSLPPFLLEIEGLMTSLSLR